MRRRKDPIPPGAEIYWGDRGKYWAFVLVLIIFYLTFFAMAMQIRNKPFGAEDCLVAGILVVGLLIIFLVMWYLTGGYTLIDGDQVETRGGFGKVATFRLSEITGYRFGPTRRNPIIRQNQTLWLYRGEERIEADFQQRPGRDRLRELLRARGLLPQLLTEEERSGVIALRRNLRVEGNELVLQGERIPLSQTEIRIDFVSPNLCRKGGKKISGLRCDDLACRDLLALALERNGVTVGDALPRL